ncbi:MAG: TonB-dependent receptor [Burkholderiales bacterium]
MNQPAPTASRLGLRASETPASLDIIERETLLERGQYNQRDVAASAVGMTYIGTGGNGSSALTLRGFTGHGSVMQLLDGTRLFVGSGTVTLAADTWGFERIEVLRGPASVLYGDSAIGGAINYVTKKPSFTPSHELLVAAGSYGTSQLAAGSGGPLGEKVAYRADVSRQASSGYVDRADYERLTGSGSLLFQVTPALNITLALDVLRNDDARFWGTPAINGRVDPSLRRQNYNVSDSLIRYEDSFARAKVEWTPSAAWLVRNEIFHYGSDRHWRNLENYTFQTASNLIRRTGYLEIMHDLKQSGTRVDATWNGAEAKMPIRVVLGAEVNRVDYKNINNSPFTGSSDVALSGFDPGSFLNVAGTRLGANSITDQRALFSELLWTLAPSLKAVAGLRKEFYEVDSRNAQSGFQVSKDYRPTTGRVGLVWEARKDLSLYGQFSNGVDPITGLLTVSPANAAFDLAKGRQVEAGLKQTLPDGWGEWTLAGYRIVKSNLLSRDPVNPTVTQQIGEQSSRGVELSARLTPARGWMIDGSVAALKARFDTFDELVSGARVSRAGNLPPNVPERVANLLVSHQVNAAWRAGAGARQVSRRFANNANTIDLPAYSAFDAYVTWAPQSNWSVTLRGRNLGDRLYLLAPYNAGNQFYLGEPRSIELSLRARF